MASEQNELAPPSTGEETTSAQKLQCLLDILDVLISLSDEEWKNLTSEMPDEMSKLEFAKLCARVVTHVESTGTEIPGTSMVSAEKKHLETDQCDEWRQRSLYEPQKLINNINTLIQEALQILTSTKTQETTSRKEELKFHCLIIKMRNVLKSRINLLCSDLRAPRLAEMQTVVGKIVMVTLDALEGDGVQARGLEQTTDLMVSAAERLKFKTSTWHSERNVSDARSEEATFKASRAVSQVLLSNIGIWRVSASFSVLLSNVTNKLDLDVMKQAMAKSGFPSDAILCQVESTARQIVGFILSLQDDLSRSSFQFVFGISSEVLVDRVLRIVLEKVRYLFKEIRDLSKAGPTATLELDEYTYASEPDQHPYTITCTNNICDVVQLYRSSISKSCFEIHGRMRELQQIMTTRRSLMRNLDPSEGTTQIMVTPFSSQDVETMFGDTFQKEISQVVNNDLSKTCYTTSPDEDGPSASGSFPFLRHIRRIPFGPCHSQKGFASTAHKICRGVHKKVFGLFIKVQESPSRKSLISSTSVEFETEDPQVTKLIHDSMSDGVIPKLVEIHKSDSLLTNSRSSVSLQSPVRSEELLIKPTEIVKVLQGAASPLSSESSSIAEGVVNDLDKFTESMYSYKSNVERSSQSLLSLLKTFSSAELSSESGSEGTTVSAPQSIFMWLRSHIRHFFNESVQRSLKSSYKTVSSVSSLDTKCSPTNTINLPSSTPEAPLFLDQLSLDNEEIPFNLDSFIDELVAAILERSMSDLPEALSDHYVQSMSSEKVQGDVASIGSDVLLRSPSVSVTNLRQSGDALRIASLDSSEQLESAVSDIVTSVLASLEAILHSGCSPILDTHEDSSSSRTLGMSRSDEEQAEIWFTQFRLFKMLKSKLKDVFSPWTDQLREMTTTTSSTNGKNVSWMSNHMLSTVENEASGTIGSFSGSDDLLRTDNQTSRVVEAQEATSKQEDSLVTRTSSEGSDRESIVMDSWTKVPEVLDSVRTDSKCPAL